MNVGFRQHSAYSVNAQQSCQPLSVCSRTCVQKAHITLEQCSLDHGIATCIADNAIPQVVPAMELMLW
jgi:hypothetical protein